MVHLMVHLLTVKGYVIVNFFYMIGGAFPGIELYLETL